MQVKVAIVFKLLHMSFLNTTVHNLKTYQVSNINNNFNVVEIKSNMLFCTTLLIITTTCLAKPFDVEEIISTLQVYMLLKKTFVIVSFINIVTITFTVNLRIIHPNILIV